jgi:hypothetical protein
MDSETLTIEEVDADKLGLGLIELDVTVDYQYSPAEAADLREIGYSRGTPACRASVSITGVHVNSFTGEYMDGTRDQDDYDWDALDVLAAQYIENDREGYEENLLANHGA